jgi:hypothetical protein
VGVANSLLLTVRRRNVEVRVVIAPILFFGEEKKKDLTQSSQRRRTEVAERRKRTQEHSQEWLCQRGNYTGRWRRRRRQKVRRSMPIRIREALRPIQRPRTPQCPRKQSQAPKGRPMSQ